MALISRILLLIVKIRELGLRYCIYVQVIMFLSRSEEETTANRKLAKDLVDKWVGLYIIFGTLYCHLATPLPQNHEKSILVFC